MVLLSEISSLFVKISICDMVIAEFADLFNILLWCMQSECVHALTHRIKLLKLSSTTKGATVVNLSQKNMRN